MGYQSEAELENQLIKQLNEQGYKSVAIKDYDNLLANFREQFYNFNREKLGSVPLSDKEWDRLLNYMLGRSVFESAKVLRDKYVLERDDNSKVYVSFIDEDHLASHSPDYCSRQVHEQVRCDYPLQWTSARTDRAEAQRHGPQAGN